MDDIDLFDRIVFGFFSLFGVAVLVIIICVLVGIHYETGKGSHVGYITSTEETGLFFKTKRAYVKTDTQSSQEDSYCVIDQTVFSKLQKLSENKAHVEIQYISWITAGIKYCAQEGDIITSVKELNK